MGCISRVWMWFPKERHACWAKHVAEEMIKLIYAQIDREAPPWIAEAEKLSPLSKRYLAFRHEAAAYPLDPDHTALKWLSRDRTMIFIERCQDICRWTGIECEEELIPQLFYAYALRFPRVPFTALYRHEMTVTGALQLIRMQYDGYTMHVQEKNGEWPMDEDDWSGEHVYDYVDVNGAFIRKDQYSPKREVRETQNEAVARTLDAIERRCRPILVGLGGSIACRLDAPESDMDIRGVFLNPPEELIGLHHETESLRPDSSDTVLYGLRKAMRLLLDCNPNAIELLGLREQDILFCSEEGRLILDNAQAFLSQKAISTFNSCAIKRRRQIRKLLSGEKPDRKVISKEMMHLIRTYAMGGNLLVSGRVTACREREHTLLMDIQTGRYQDAEGLPTQEFDRLLEMYMGSFNDAALNTRLPKEPDWKTANQLTMDIVQRSLSYRQEC